MESKKLQMDNFSSRLSAVIQESGLKRGDFAKRSGVGVAALGKWLSGKLVPKSEQLLALAEAADVTMEWLLTGNGPKSRKALRERIEKDLLQMERADLAWGLKIDAYNYELGRSQWIESVLEESENSFIGRMQSFRSTMVSMLNETLDLAVLVTALAETEVLPENILEKVAKLQKLMPVAETSLFRILSESVALRHLAECSPSSLRNLFRRDHSEDGDIPTAPAEP